MRGRLETGSRIEKEKEGIPDAYHQAYREGNLSYPQRGMGIISMTAAVALSDPHFDAERFSASMWSDQQMRDMHRDLERAHAAHDVHLRREVTDTRLRFLWQATTEGVIDVAGILCGLPYHRRQRISADDPDYVRKRELESAQRAHILKLTLQDPAKAERVKRILSSFAATLHVQAATEMGKQARAIVVEKNELKNRAIYEKIFNHAVVEYEKKSGDRLTFEELEGLKTRLAL